MGEIARLVASSFGRLYAIVTEEAFLLLHSSVLEPDLHLSLAESQSRGNLYSSRSRQVLVVVEFLLEFRQLLVCEVRSSEVRLMSQVSVIR